MIETEEQRRWWFATHPEFSWSRQGGQGRRQREEKENDDKVRPEDVDAYVDNALQYVHGPVAGLLKSVKRHFGTEADLRKPEQRLAYSDESAPGSDSQSPAVEHDRDAEGPGFWDAVLKGLDNTLEDWERWFGLGGGLSNHRRKLSDNMKAENMKAGKQPRPDDHAAHHIVAPGESRYLGAKEARAILDEFGIDIDHAANGVWLPNKPGVGPGSYHPSLHTRTYYREVENLLRDATTREDAIRILRAIGESLKNGTFPR